MNKTAFKRGLMVFVSALPTAVLAQQVDLKGAEIKPDGPDSFVIDGFKLGGDRLKANFRWAPDKKAFFMEPLSVQKVQAPVGGGCVLLWMNGAGGQYLAASSAQGAGEVGALRSQWATGEAFTVAWFSGPLSMNPYLVGRDVQSLKDGKAYGLLGGVSKRFNGFWPGQLVEVLGDLRKGAIQVRGLESNSVLAFKTPDGRYLKGATCRPASTGRIDDDDNQWYASTVTGPDDGILRPYAGHVRPFEVAWNQRWSSGPGGVWEGVLGPVQSNPRLPGFQTGDRALVTAIGQFGYAVTSLAPNGQGKATAVFLVPPQQQ